MLDAAQDIRYEILDLNSNGMYMCQSMALDDAESILTEAYQRLQNDTTIQDPAFLDQLKATTLNNLGVVQCHKGAHRKALDHLDAAYALESRAGWVSPTTSLNLCAAHNALQHYDNATQCALKCIESLHHTVLNNPQEDVNVLWGAAWHNLGVAQLNTAKPNEEESCNLLGIFRNAMKSTQDLLGPTHPMTAAVHDTYRVVREQLKDKGAFKVHEARHEPVAAMFPPLPNSRGGTRTGQVYTPRTSPRRPPPELFVTLHHNDRSKYREPAPNEAYITKELMESRASQSRGGKRGGGSQQSGRKKVKGLPSLRGTLIDAGMLYTDPHPLLKAIKGATSPRNSIRNRTYAERDNTFASTAGGSPRRIEARYQQQVRGAQHVPAPPKQKKRSTVGASSDRGFTGGTFAANARDEWGFAGSGGGGANAGHKTKASPRRLSDLLAGDMWVELHDDLTSAGSNGMGSLGPTKPTSRAPVRPAYAQALYVMDPVVAGSDRVVEPASHAVLDEELQQQVDQQQQQQQTHVPTAPKQDPPAVQVVQRPSVPPKEQHTDDKDATSSPPPPVSVGAPSPDAALDKEESDSLHALADATPTGSQYPGLSALKETLATNAPAEDAPSGGDAPN